MSLLPPRPKKTRPPKKPGTGARIGRPKLLVPVVALPLRVNAAEFNLIQRAVKKADSHAAHRFITRKDCKMFCLRAAVAAAKKELGIVDDVSLELSELAASPAQLAPRIDA